MLSSMFGSEDSPVAVKHDEELLVASRRARAKLPALRAAFDAGLAPDEYIQVKAPFQRPDGKNEWMWVEVTSWKGDSHAGRYACQDVFPAFPGFHGKARTPRQTHHDSRG